MQQFMYRAVPAACGATAFPDPFLNGLPLRCDPAPLRARRGGSPLSCAPFAPLLPRPVLPFARPQAHVSGRMS